MKIGTEVCDIPSASVRTGHKRSAWYDLVTRLLETITTPELSGKSIPVMFEAEEKKPTAASIQIHLNSRLGKSPAEGAPKVRSKRMNDSEVRFWLELSKAEPETAGTTESAGGIAAGSKG